MDGARKQLSPAMNEVRLQFRMGSYPDHSRGAGGCGRRIVGIERGRSNRLPRREVAPAHQAPGLGSFSLCWRGWATAASPEVYRAHPGIRTCSAKSRSNSCCPARLSGEAEFETMLREARALASVHHPNIVPVHGIDRHDGRVGFWTDFVRGKTLSALVRSRAPLARAKRR